MSDKGSASSAGSSGLLLPAGIFIALLAAGAVYFVLEGAPNVDEADVTAVIDPAATEITTAPLPAPAADEPSVETPAEAPGDEAAPAGAETAQSDAAPSIDEVRVEGDGLVVVAGRGAPGSRVDVLVDGEVVTSADVDASGAFAALGTLAASDAARTLTLRAGTGEAALASAEEIILAPIAVNPEIAPEPAEPQTENLTIATVSEPEPTETPVEIAEVSDTAETPLASAETDIETSPDGAVVLDPPAEASVADEQPAETEPETAVSVAGQVEETPNPEEVVASQVPAAPSQVAEAESPAAPDQDVADAPDSQQVAVLKSDEEGVTLLQPQPTAPASVTLDTIGYSDDGTLQLSGRASAEAVEVRAYLNNRLVAGLPVRAGGQWRGDVPDIAPGVYTLRIDALDAQGEVSSRLETPFKREAPEILAAAEENSEQGGPVRAVTVQAGDTLWAIARDRYGNGVLYVQVFEANRASIRDPDLIYPGQVFDLPGE